MKGCPCENVMSWQNCEVVRRLRKRRFRESHQTLSSVAYPAPDSSGTTTLVIRLANEG